MELPLRGGRDSERLHSLRGKATGRKQKYSGEGLQTGTAFREMGAGRNAAARRSRKLSTELAPTATSLDEIFACSSELDRL